MKSGSIDVSKLKGRGKSLYVAVSQSGFSNKDAAERALYKENTFYTHVKQEFLDFKIMARYAKAIKHDFSIQYPEILSFQPDNSVEQAEKESKAYLDLQRKYTALLEKNQLMIERNAEKYAELENKHNALLAKYNSLKNNEKK
ncbi:hypothetical protein [Pedobacter cryoconitis]|uniref:Uncharacterized protein n=1 Tax=Pedobacter cryoconitis TaxID=188932 RepID=A0A327SS60_9SPHI|nr:hypothetical protein [Pedobacter cryoconitis]RAJ31739.1 hypothetical protein LY11_02239 [Pedobacter cryoconitis]